MEFEGLRREVAETARAMSESGLVEGTNGNVSVRTGDGNVLITPSGMPYEKMGPEDVALVDPGGGLLEGDYSPSVETPMHTSIYKARPGTGSIVHTHSRYSTVLACLGLEIPPIHYMLAAVSSEGRVPIAPYAIFGSEELAANAARALGESHGACLLQNHGTITVGGGAADAFAKSEILEEMAELYYHARLGGEPVLLSSEQIAEVVDKIAAGYGQMRSLAPEATE